MVSPQTGKVFNVPQGKHWVYAPANMKAMIEDNRIWFGKDGNSFPAVKQFLTDVSGRRPSSLLMYEDYGHTDMAKKDLIKLFPDLEKVPFDTPKPVKLIKMLSIIGSNNEDIILDFFAGSSTTAQSIFELNAENTASNRKFILVQVPEVIENNPGAEAIGLKTISDVGKERIRRAGKKIKEELASKNKKEEQEGGLFDDKTKQEEGTSTLDTGFRVFRIDSGNMKEDLEQAPSEVEQMKLDFYLDNMKDDRTELDLLFGCMLNWGVQLSLPMSMETVDGCNIYTVNEGDLVACLTKDQPVTANIVRAIAEKSPLRVLFRDGSFASDASKINIFEQFKQLMDWSDEEIIKNVRVL